jgi:hypothetical protein
MKRRALLKGAAAVALGASVPGWIRSAYAADACDKAGSPAVSPTRGLITVSQGFRAAQRSGRPLLVLVIPQNPDDRWQPGQAFGELINNATVDEFLPFAMVEVVCARMATLRTLVPSAPQGEPLMVLVETDRSPAQARALNVKLSYDRAARWDPKLEDELIDARIHVLSNLLRSALVEEPYLSRYAEQNRLALTAAEQGAVTSGAWTDALLERAGPALTKIALARNDTVLKSRLVANAQGRVRARPPAGARWASSTGCGVDIENAPPEERMLVACGMGHTPERSRRFLYFFKHRRGEQIDDEG